ncbi:MAG: IclR family transcriptional regulator [Firmicutes bacterium]|jgi:DNA-binding IclR family transcriptional regulator|nr:IclR family transcriptional regulator [Bacillota bacterium]
MASNSSDGMIKSVQKSLKIIKYILKADKEVSIKELQENLGYSPSTIHHLLKTMIFEGFISQNSRTKKYNIGRELFNASLKFNNYEKHFIIAKDLIQEVVDITGETTSIFIKSGNSSVCVYGIEPNKILKAFLVIGRSVPLHSTASGKSLLAFQPENEINEYIYKTNLLRDTENTIYDKEHLIDELKTTRLRGYALEIDEYEYEISGVASPIFDDNGEAIAALTVIGPTGRLKQEKLNQIGKIITKKAMEISDLMSNASY